MIRQHVLGMEIDDDDAQKEQNLNRSYKKKQLDGTSESADIARKIRPRGNSHGRWILVRTIV